MQILFPVMCMGAGGWLLLKGRWHAYMAFTILLWLVAPEMRRFVDWQSSYHAFSLITMTPAMVSLLALPWAVMARRRVHRDVAVLFGVAGIVMAYSFAVGVLENGPFAAAADLGLIVAPLVFGLFVLTVPDDDVKLRNIVRHTALWGVLLLGGYSLIQFFLLPGWDEAWLIESRVGNLGPARAGEMRPWGTLGHASYLGHVLAVLLVVLIAERRTAWQVVAGALGLTALGLSLLRAGWLDLTVGLLVLGLLGRLRIWRVVAVAVALFVALSATGSPVVERINERVLETTTEGTSDTSLTARLWFQYEVAPQALANVQGAGMGATGRAAVASEVELPNQGYASFDTGIFESLVRYGSLGGLALLGCLFLTAWGIAWRSRRGTLFDACCAAAVVSLCVAMVFTDVQRGVFGVMLWMLMAVQGRIPRPPLELPRLEGGAHRAPALAPSPQPASSAVPAGRCSTSAS